MLDYGHGKLAKNSMVNLPRSLMPKLLTLKKFPTTTPAPASKHAIRLQPHAARRNCPKWSTVVGGWLETRIASTDEIPQPLDGILSVGRLVTDLAMLTGGLSPDHRLRTERTRFEFPLLLSLAGKPSLVIRSRGDSRAEASRLLQSSMLRFLTRAGPEIGVASTKAFTTQLAAIFVLVMQRTEYFLVLSLQGLRQVFRSDQRFLDNSLGAASLAHR